MASNTLLTPTQITRKALEILHQKANFIGKMNRQYDDRFAQSGAKIGDTLDIRLPNQYTVRDGSTLSAQDTTEKKTSLTVANQKGVDMNFSSNELTLDLDDFAERILEPAMAVLVANVEADVFNVYRDVYNFVDGTGSAATFSEALKARKQLTDNLAPMSPRCLTLDTQTNLDLVDDLKGLFHDSTQIAEQYREGMVGVIGGFGEIYENTIIPRHAVGSGSGYQTNGASQTGSTLDIDTGSGAINDGDVFTIAGVNRVHPETKQDTGQLQQFVVTSDYSGGAGTINIAPEIIPSGPYQNVTNAAGDNQSITFAGSNGSTHDMSLGFHRDAFTFATADLVMPDGVDFASRQTYDGISLRIVRQYDISSDTYPCRLDILYGYKAIRPETAVRIANN